MKLHILIVNFLKSGNSALSIFFDGLYKKRQILNTDLSFDVGWEFYRACVFTTEFKIFTGSRKLLFNVDIDCFPYILEPIEQKQN